MNHESLKSKMKVWVWDDADKGWQSLIVEIPGRPLSGLQDEYIKINGSEIFPDDDGNFVRKNYSEDELDRIHTFAITRLTIDLWEKGTGEKIRWLWNQEDDDQRPLNIIIDDNEKNAGFHLAKESLIFGRYETSNVPTCKSLDIVAHETTHSLIEAIRPDIHYLNTVESMAVIEALADLSPIFLQCSNADFIGKSLLLNKFEFQKPNKLSEFAEGIKDGERGIRSALDLEGQGRDAYALAASVVNHYYLKIVKQWERSQSGEELKLRVDELIRGILSRFLHLKEISPKSIII